MTETRGIVSITQVQPKPRTEFNDRRKRCVHCSNLAAKDVFKEEGATIIERYCDSCIFSLKLKI
ncbi:MAG: hypothetical protein WAZ77_04820 [Candidatus Nitrosopolaris sp.]|jgi:hypothetical protein